MDFGAWFNNFWASTGITLIKVFAILVFGLLLIRLIMRYANKGLKASSMEAGLSSFLLSVIKVILYIILIFLVLSTLGVSMGAFIAALSAAGLAIALALQDSLSNLASGILILVNKPFVEGDYIKVGSEEGSVKSVRIFTTQIETADKKIITLPNKSIVNGNVINYTCSPMRRLDITFCVPFGTNQQLVKDTVKNVFKGNQYIMKSPEMSIGVDKYDERGLRFALKMWCKSEEYWDLYADAYEKLTDALNTAKIQITNNETLVKMSPDDINTKKEQLKKSLELRQEKELKKQNKIFKKTKIQILDEDGIEKKQTRDSKVEFKEPLIIGEDGDDFEVDAEIFEEDNFPFASNNEINEDNENLKENEIDVNFEENNSTSEISITPKNEVVLKQNNALIVDSNEEKPKKKRRLWGRKDDK